MTPGHSEPQAKNPGAGVGIEGVALVKGGPGHERAKRFIDWMLSPAAQNLLAQWHLIPVHPEATMNDATRAMSRQRMVHPVVDMPTARHDQLLARWRTATGN